MTCPKQPADDPTPRLAIVELLRRMDDRSKRELRWWHKWHRALAKIVGGE